MPGLSAGQVDELLPGMWRVVAPNPSFMTGAGTNSYVLGGREAALVVDPGPDDPVHRDRLLQTAPGPVRYVVVTHHHEDHAPGAAPLAALEGATVLAGGARGGFRPDGELHDGDVVAVPGWRLVAVETPGHASDHVCFVATPEPAAGGSGALGGAALAGGGATGGPPPQESVPPAWPTPVLFSGDHILGGTTVVVPPPDGDMAAYLHSLHKLAALRPPIGTIAPGHGDLIADPAAMIASYVSHRLERERQVLAALSARGSATTAELVDDIYTTRPGPLHQAAEISVWAHLRKLGDEGRARSADRDDPAASWSIAAP